MKAKKPKKATPKGPRELPTRTLEASEAGSVKGGLESKVETKYNETAKGLIQSIGR